MNFKPSRMYGYVRSRQLENTYSNDPSIGTWTTTNYRVSKGWGWPEEHDFPYGDAKDWPPQEPPGIDLLAKKNRTMVYQKIKSINDCKIALANNSLAVIAIEITDEWATAKNGNIVKDNDHTKNLSHSILLVGYNNHEKRLFFRNSWGISWGDQGNGSITYDYFNDNFIEGYFNPLNIRQIITEKDEIVEMSYELPNQLGSMFPAIELYNKNQVSNNKDSIIEISYGFSNPLGSMFDVIELYSIENDDYIGWCFSTFDNNILEVEEIFIKPEYRKKNYGTKLLNHVKKISNELNLPIKIWIPHSDSNNNITNQKIAEFFNLTIKQSSECWASYELSK
jgi:hypothetical protein